MSHTQADCESEENSGKKLYIFRHGKSDWEASFSSDHERPLAERGKYAAEQMGKHLVRIGQVPELVLCSTSIRTKQTLALAKEKGGWICDIKYYRELYLASAKEALEIIQKQDDTVEKLMIVSHEPMCSILIGELVKGANVKFPTASLARISLKVNHWKDVKINRGHLDWLLTPKALFK